MTTASTRPPASPHPLARPDFLALVCGSTLAKLSVGFFEVPVMWWLAQEGGTRAVASVAFVGALAYVLAAPAGGVLADRLPKVRLAQGGYLIDGLLTALAGLLLALGAFPLAAVLALLALTNLVTAARSPALGALVPLLLEPDQLERGNAAMGLGSTVAALASFAVAGIATAAFGPAGALVAGAGLLLAATVALAWVREPDASAPADGAGPTAATDGAAATGGTGGADAAAPSAAPARPGWSEGFRALRGSPLLASVAFTAALLNFVLAPTPVLFAPYAIGFGADARGYGALAAAIVAGQLLGLAGRNLRSWNRPLAVLVVGTLTLGGGIALLSAAPSLPLAMACAALTGVATAAMNVELQTLFQTRIDRERLGRAMGVFTALTRAAQPAGFALAGALAGVAGPRAIFLGMGALIALTSLLWLRPSVARQLTAGERAGSV